MGRLNLDVKFMVLIISVSVLFVKMFAFFFHLFRLASFRGLVVVGVLQGNGGTLHRHNIIMLSSFSKPNASYSYPALLGLRLIQKRIVMLCCFAQFLYEFQISSLQRVVFLMFSLAVTLHAFSLHSTACFNKISFSLTSGAEVTYHHGLKAVTNTT